jgi:DNA-binding NarL/FixJ family response regulator
MVGITIFSSDPVLRRNLEQLQRDDPAVVIVEMVDQASSLRELDNRDGVDVLMADVPTQELLAEYRAGRDPIPLVVLLEGADGEDAVRALNAGARAVVDRSASGNEIIAAVKAVAPGLSSWRRNFLRGCSVRLRLPMICSRPIVPAALD